MRKIKDEALRKYWEDRDTEFELNKKNYKGPHCCLDMHYGVEDKDNPDNISPCDFNKKFRGYYLIATKGPGGKEMSYCPFCGKRLPKELSDEWFDILEKEYGLDLPLTSKQYDRIPAEFLTDEWWKKRGL
jgi:hypothetical protein